MPRASKRLSILDEHPEALERLRVNRDLVPDALEEALRYYSPLKLTIRGTTTETTIGDQRVEAGTLLFVWLAAANRDEAQFPDADQFHIEREPNRHLGFGRGIHFCLGAPLARLEAKAALNAMLDRLPAQPTFPSPRFKHMSQSNCDSPVLYLDRVGWNTGWGGPGDTICESFLSSNPLPAEL